MLVFLKFMSPLRLHALNPAASRTRPMNDSSSELGCKPSTRDATTWASPIFSGQGMQHIYRKASRLCVALAACIVATSASSASQATCEKKSGATRAPLIELYTSEGCSSCPPADKWLSTLVALPSDAVVLAFHVSYWDYIGWVDRFATPAYNVRQRAANARLGLTGVYTPQVMRDGNDWRDWYRTLPGNIQASTSRATSQVDIGISRNRHGVFEADVVPKEPGRSWKANWVLTEDRHSSRVRAGENRGETLYHDRVVRELEETATQTGARRLVFKPQTPNVEHAQRVALVVSDSRSGDVLQTLDLAMADCQLVR